MNSQILMKMAEGSVSPEELDALAAKAAMQGDPGVFMKTLEDAAQRLPDAAVGMPELPPMSYDDLKPKGPGMGAMQPPPGAVPAQPQQRPADPMAAMMAMQGALPQGGQGGQGPQVPTGRAPVVGQAAPTQQLISALFQKQGSTQPRLPLDLGKILAGGGR